MKCLVSILKQVRNRNEIFGSHSEVGSERNQKTLQCSEVGSERNIIFGFDSEVGSEQDRKILQCTEVGSEPE